MIAKQLRLEHRRFPQVRVTRTIDNPALIAQLHAGKLDDVAPSQVWNVDEHSRALAYSTHGLARYFGKFPPPVARHFMELASPAGGRILDPMCGSGTAVVEGILLDRDVVGMDINPLSILYARAKTIAVPRATLDSVVADAEHIVRRTNPLVPAIETALRNPYHWFLPKTIAGLGRIKRTIAKLGAFYPDCVPLLETSLAAIIRSCSRATSQQGRLFLDANSAVEDPIPVFLRRLAQNAEAIAELPHSARSTPQLGSALLKMSGEYDAALVHPPYFNSYKYSSVMSLEMAWLEIDRRPIAADEVREGFKQGKNAKLSSYLEDLATVLTGVTKTVKPGGIVGLMVGDTVLCGDYVPVARPIIDSALRIGLRVETIAVRPPRFTEASWVASQRRTAAALGANIADYVILFKKGT